MHFRVTWIEPEHRYLIAEKLDAGDFEVAPGARLGPIALRPELSQPRALDSLGQRRLDLFVFSIADSTTLAGVAVEDVLEFVGPSLVS